MKHLLLVSFLLSQIYSFFGQTSIDYVSGTANISVPIGGIQGPTMNIPISLDYNTSGIRVNDVASWVGTGWNLNAGGQVLRIQNGTPDEIVEVHEDDPYYVSGSVKAAGYLWCKDFYYNEISHQNEYPTTFDSHFAGNTVDLSPDEFIVNAPGLQAKFIFSFGEHHTGDFFDYDPSYRTTISPVMIIPYQNLKVEYSLDPSNNGTFNEFIVTNESGYSYYFSEQQFSTTSIHLESNDGAVNRTEEQSTCNNWLLTRIVNPMGIEEAVFTYEENPTESSILTYSEIRFKNDGLAHHKIEQFEDLEIFESDIFGTDREYDASCEIPYLWLSQYVTTSQKFKHLIAIQSKDYLVEFIKSGDERVDLAGDYALTEIVMSKSANVFSKVRLTFDYFQSDATMNIPSFVPEQDKYRLRLLKIQGFNELEEALDRGTSFEYSEDPVVYRNSFAQDHWGFYNAQTDNTRLACFHDINDGVSEFNQSDRRPNDNSMCQLTRVYNAYNGHETFEFEPHTYSNIEGDEIDGFHQTEDSQIVISSSITAGYYDDPLSVSNSVEIEISESQWVYLETTAFQNDNSYAVATDPVDLFFFYMQHPSVTTESLIAHDRYFQVTITNADNSIFLHPFTKWMDQGEELEISNQKEIFLPAGTYTITTIIGSSENYLNVCDANLEATLHYLSPSGNLQYYQIAGGRRIKSITLDDGDSDHTNDITRRLEYNSITNSNVGSSSGFLLSNPNYMVSIYNGMITEMLLRHTSGVGITNDDYRFTNTYDCSLLSFNSSSVNPLETFGGSVVMYETVEEYYENTGNTTGKTRYEYFITEFGEHSGIQGSHSTARLWKNAALRFISEIDADDHMVKRIEYIYEELPDFAFPAMTLRQTRPTSMSGSYYTLIDGIESELLDQMAFGALIQSGPALIAAALTPPTEALAVVALVVNIVNMLRAGILFAFNYNIVTTINDGGAITTYTNFYQTYHADWFRIIETKSTIWTDDFSASTTTIQQVDYVDPASQISNDFIEFCSDPVLEMTWSLADPTSKRGSTFHTNSDVSIENSVSSDLMTRALIEMNDLGITNTPIETLSIVVVDGGEPLVNGGTLVKYRTIASLLNPEIETSTGVVPYEIYSLELESPIPLSTFDWSQVNNSGDFVHNSQYRLIESVLEYDQFLLPSTIEPPHDNPRTIIRAGEDGNAIVQVINSLKENVAYLGFEEIEPSDDNWLFSELGETSITDDFYGFTLPKAKTGARYGTIGNGIHRQNIATGEYFLSFWGHHGAGIDVIPISGSPSITPVHVAIDPDIAGWYYYEFVINCSQVSEIEITGASSQGIDEIRLFPTGAMMTSLQYNVFGQIISTCDANNECKYVSYNSNHQAEFTFDDNRNVRTYDYLDPVIDDEDANSRMIIRQRSTLTSGVEFSELTDFSSNSMNDMMTRSVKLDGLRRKQQVVFWDASPTSNVSTPKDIIRIFEYNQFGEEPLVFLPYTHGNSGHQFRNSPHQEQELFYQSQENIAHTAAPFAEKSFSSTPSRKVRESGFPGEEFQISTGHTVKSSISMCAINEVRKWEINTETHIVNSSATWPAESLIKYIMRDENGKILITYQDVFGRTILQRKPIHNTGLDQNFRYTDESSNQITNETELSSPNLYFVDNYYVYDEFDRLCIEVTPLMIEHFQKNEAAGISNPYKFSYQYSSTAPQYSVFLGYGKGTIYDKRSRVTGSKSPDAEWTYLIYDELNRMVMSQDGEQRLSQRWSFVRYDQFGQIVLTGTSISSNDQSTMQSAWDGQFSGLYETRIPNLASNFGYTNNAPFSAIENILTVNYYESYTFNLSGGDYGGTDTPSLRTRGKITGSVEKTTGTYSLYLTSVHHYDVDGRLIETYRNNAPVGYDRFDYVYNFNGNIIQSLRTHFNIETSAALEIFNEYEYDHVGRLVKIKQRTGPSTEPLVTLARFEYNQLGQVIRKHLHLQPGDSRAMQIMDYRYTIRGWLSKINNSNLVDDGDNMESDDVFGEELLYTESDYFQDELQLFGSECEHNALPYYNGIPGAIKWNTKNPDDAEDGTTIAEHSYVYRYDDIYRMTAGYYAREDLTMDNNLSDCNGNYGLFELGVNNFTEKVSYDVGGNILHLTRYRPVEDVAFTMDDLDFSYYRTSNQIEKIEDAAYNFPANSISTEYVDSEDLQIEYTYNKIGNLVSNNDHHLNFQYNDLGLTSIVTNTITNEFLKFSYDATGNKICKQVGNTIHLYVNGVEYISEGAGFRLVQIQTATGCARPTSLDATNETMFVYDINILDHLGNVRVVLTEENAETIQEIATIEPGNIQDELAIFDGIVGPDVNTPYDWPDVSNFNSKVSELVSGGETIGPSYLKAVSMGEIVEVDVESFYRDDEPENSTGQTLLQIFGAILANISIQGQGVLPPGEGIGMFADATSSPAQGLYSFLGTSTSQLNENYPQSYLVYIFIGSNLKIQPDYSGVVQVGDPNDIKHLQMLQRTMPADGYFYTFVTNQSMQKVYYNDLKITRQKGQIRAVNNYYPYGLMWSDPLSTTNTTFQGKEFQFNEWGSQGLDLYDFGARLYDPVIGRWHCADPMDQFDSPYNSMGDNPVVNIDPDGRWVPWGAVLSNIGAALSSITRSTTYVLPHFFERITATSHPYGKAGSILSIAGNLLSWRKDGKAILNAAGEMGVAMQAESTPLYYSYYFDRYGSFLKKELKENGDAVFIAENDAASFDDLTFTGYRGDFVKDYISVVCGEAGARDDAAGIGTVIQNRFDIQTTPQRTAAWWTNLGGAAQYDAISVVTLGNGFPDIQALSIDEILTNAPSAYAEKIKGALTALSNTSRSEINSWLDNPYFWEGKSSYKKGGYFFEKVASGILQISGQAGGSYFLHYNPKRTIDFNRRWQ